MKIEVHVHHHVDPLHLAALSEIRRLLGKLREEIMTVSAEVQAVLDRVRTATTLVESVDLGMAVLREQVNQLGMKLSSIPVAVPAATPADVAVAGLASDDKQALLSMASDLDRSIATLQRDIPTNVPIVASPVTPVQQILPASHEDDAIAAAAAVPLHGTGLPPEVPVQADGVTPTTAAPIVAPASDPTNRASGASVPNNGVFQSPANASAPAPAPTTTGPAPIPATDPIPTAFQSSLGTQPSPSSDPTGFSASNTPASTPDAPAPGAATPST